MEPPAIDELLAAARKKQAALVALMDYLPRHHAMIQPNASYTEALAALRRGDCNIAFCGKTNAGKSTLINTLLGRNILPVDDRPLSSEIVEITNCADESEERFTLLFRDGNQEDFPDLSELSRYATESGELSSRRHAEIALIRLVCCLPHLPQGLHLVDTPGIGSSYRTHTATTTLYLEQADAVVYVLKSNNQLTVDDVPLLERIRKSNRNIIVVQSASDMRTVEENADITAHNQALLRRIGFREGNEARLYYTVSAAEWQMPEEERTPEPYITNEYDAFLRAWQWMIYKTAGRDSLERGLLAAQDYICKNLKAMQDSLTVLRQEDAAETICLEAAAEALAYRREWMGAGAKRQRLCQDVAQAVAGTEEDMYARLEELHRQLKASVELINSNEEAESLSGSVSDQLNAVWLRTQQDCEERLNAVLARLDTHSCNIRHGKLTRKGILLPFSLSSFGKRDIAKIVWEAIKITCHALSGDIVGTLSGIGFAVWSHIRRRADRERSNNRIKQSVLDGFEDLFRELKSNLNKNFSSSDGISHYFYSAAMEQAEAAIYQRYQQKAEHAAELFALSHAAREEKDTLIRSLSAPRGAVEVWQQAEAWIHHQQQEIPNDEA